MIYLGVLNFTPITIKLTLRYMQVFGSHTIVRSRIPCVLACSSYVELSRGFSLKAI